MEEAKTSPLVANFVCANGDGCAKATLRMRNISVLYVFAVKNETEKAAMVIFQYYSKRQWQIELINSKPEIYYSVYKVHIRRNFKDKGKFKKVTELFI